MRVAVRCGASRFELLLQPSNDASGGSNRRFERVGEALRVPCSATAKPGAGGGYSGRSGSTDPSRGSAQPPSSSGATPGGARFADTKRQRSESPVRAFSADGADGPHARGACRHVRALTGKT
jgi:hypothetical protein